MADYWYITRRGPLVQIKVKNTEFQPFLLRLEPGGKLQRQRARGIYESHVMSYLNKNLTAESVFWELGAAWGYFSVAAATRATQVCSFEMMAERVDYLETAVEANGLDNITVINDTLDSETDFTKYPHPDTVLVDIEGWEYTVLSPALEQLSDVSTWIVEVHPDQKEVELDDSVTAVQTLFENAGYSISSLNEWSDNNVHLVAEK